MLWWTDRLRSSTTRVLLLSDQMRTFSTVEPAKAAVETSSKSAQIVSRVRATSEYVMRNHEDYVR